MNPLLPCSKLPLSINANDQRNYGVKERFYLSFHSSSIPLLSNLYLLIHLTCLPFIGLGFEHPIFPKECGIYDFWRFWLFPSKTHFPLFLGISTWFTVFLGQLIPILGIFHCVSYRNRDLALKWSRNWPL